MVLEMLMDDRGQFYFRKDENSSEAEWDIYDEEATGRNCIKVLEDSINEYEFRWFWFMLKVRLMHLYS